MCRRRGSLPDSPSPGPAGLELKWPLGVPCSPAFLTATRQERKVRRQETDWCAERPLQVVGPPPLPEYQLPWVAAPPPCHHPLSWIPGCVTVLFCRVPPTQHVVMTLAARAPLQRGVHDAKLPPLPCAGRRHGQRQRRRSCGRRAPQQPVSGGCSWISAKGMWYSHGWAPGRHRLRGGGASSAQAWAVTYMHVASRGCVKPPLTRSPRMAARATGPSLGPPAPARVKTLRAGRRGPGMTATAQSSVTAGGHAASGPLHGRRVALGGWPCSVRVKLAEPEFRVC